MNKKSFTLIELIIVLAIISTLTFILLTILKPSEILKNLRDTRRINDLKNIEKYILLLESEHQYGVLPFYGTSSIVYISLPDNSPTCSSWINQLPSLPSGYQYNCVATPTNIDSTGWIPINFSQSSLLNIQKLPIDPINRPPYYYTYVSGGSYELTAKLESFEKGNKYHISSKDGGDHPLLYEVGDNKTLTPLEVQGRGATYDQLTYSDPSLVGYWSFDEGTGTIAYDSSGYNNNGTLYNFNWTATSGWIDGKVNKALSFDGVDDYVGLTDIDLEKFTIAVWVKQVENCSTGYITIVGRENGSTSVSGWTASLIIYSSGNLAGGIGDGTAYAFNSNVITISNGEWYHLVMTYDKSKIRFYVNGVYLSNKDVNTTITPRLTNYPWKIGKDANKFFSGLIDEVYIYNRALSPEEIKALYEATK